MKRVKATEARRQWFDLLKQAGKPGVFIVIQHRDQPDVVMMSIDEYEGWMETMEIMSDPTLLRDIEKGMAEKQSGNTVPLEDVLKKIKA
ncbi:type II toxin-antitoxin system Phd/YefM family antitoxin [Candidatus Peribacteria bacterium]|nr:type II toxin-antitoxin system Phd/YefM family antitoxin [Candidatus Peribacteria bacterium]